MKMKINFLGTGQAVPTARRNHSAVLLNYEDENILIDCGEGTQRQFRKAKLNPCKLTRILITHWHGDHVLGLPGLLQTLALNEYNKTLHVYVPKGTGRFFNLIQKMFVHAGRDIKIELEEVKGKKVFETENFYVESANMKHGTPCLAYSFIEKDKLRIDKEKMKKIGLKPSPLLKKLKEGKSIKIEGKTVKPKDVIYKEKGKKITFVFDTSFNNDAIKISKNSDFLICESTYSEEEKELAKEYKHLTSKQAANIAKKSRSKKLVLTHVSQRYDKNPELLLNESKSVFKNTELAEDFKEFIV